jgi:hypothetical protein
MAKIFRIAIGSLGIISTLLAAAASGAAPSERRVSAFNIQNEPIDIIEIYKTPRNLATAIGIMPEAVKLYPNRHCVFTKETKEFDIFLNEISRTRYYKDFIDGEFRWQIDFKNRSGLVVHRLYSGPVYSNVTFVNAIWDGNNITIENRFLRWAEDNVNAESNFCEDLGR